MINEISIKVGELVVLQGNFRVKSIGIGSCVVVVIFDKKRKMGGITHSMLPEGNKEPKKVVEKVGTINKYYGKYVDESIDMMVEELLAMGVNKKDLRAKLVGGSAMFKSYIQNNTSVGERNIKMAKDKLEKYGITLVSEDTGGSIGRTIDFNLANSVLNVNSRI